QVGEAALAEGVLEADVEVRRLLGLVDEGGDGVAQRLRLVPEGEVGRCEAVVIPGHGRTPPRCADRRWGPVAEAGTRGRRRSGPGSGRSASDPGRDGRLRRRGGCGRPGGRPGGRRDRAPRPPARQRRRSVPATPPSWRRGSPTRTGRGARG